MSKFNEVSAEYYRHKLRAYKDFQELERIEKALNSKPEKPTIVERLWAEGKQIEDLYNLFMKINKLPPFERRDNFLDLLKEAMSETVFTTEVSDALRAKDEEINALKQRLNSCVHDFDNQTSVLFMKDDLIADLQREVARLRAELQTKGTSKFSLWR